MTNPAEFDCRSCGACCAAQDDTPAYAHVDDEDYDRLELGGFEDMALFNEAHSAMKTKRLLQPGRGFVACVALTGEIGVSTSCSIYDARPNVCRRFQAGDEHCLRAREESGIGR
jgi:Fe-S-cluster containining protein